MQNQLKTILNILITVSLLIMLFSTNLSAQKVNSWKHKYNPERLESLAIMDYKNSQYTVKIMGAYVFAKEFNEPHIVFFFDVIDKDFTFSNFYLETDDGRIELTSTESISNIDFIITDTQLMHKDILDKIITDSSLKITTSYYQGSLIFNYPPSEMVNFSEMNIVSPLDVVLIFE
jgi:hypothetical protein